MLLIDLSGEHPMEWHTTYLEYLHTFEGKIERFISSAGYEIHDFYEECKNILAVAEDCDQGNVDTDVQCPVETRFFLEALLATSEYTTFIYLMKGEMEQYRAEVEADIISGDCGRGYGPLGDDVDLDNLNISAPFPANQASPKRDEFNNTSGSADSKDGAGVCDSPKGTDVDSK